MSERFIPVVDARQSAWPAAAAAPAPGSPLRDTLQRPLRDLRISVTDRCNFRCTYCMPRAVFDGSYRFLPQADLLSFEEIARLGALFVHLGVEKIRLTGGEPLLRRDLPRLIAMLSALRTPAGRPLDIALTTNGSLLTRLASALADAGLTRLTVSLDALDDAVFRRMNDADYPVADVLAGIEAAGRAGLGPVKINMVVQRGVNEGEILPMARRFKGSGHVLRFIEYMDVGNTNGWQADQVVPAADIIARIAAEMPLQPLAPHYGGEVAQRWRYADGSGEIGTIASVTHAFCRDCTRLRLSTEGKLYLCLFATRGYDLRALLRAGADDEHLLRALSGLWQQRDDRYSELRQQQTAAGQPAKVEMSYIGG